jgi:hypothetical protein
MTYKIPDTDVVLEKGILTVIPVLALHHDPKYYPDPERFDPERFSEEEKAKRHQYVYLPFGEGPRICIGKFDVSKQYITVYKQCQKTLQCGLLLFSLEVLSRLVDIRKQQPRE